ncbi:MAG TPA: mycothiol synthase [Nocardioides sp.]
MVEPRDETTFTVREVTDLDTRTRDDVLGIDADVRTTHGGDALDEAGRRHLEHRGLADARLWLAEASGPDGRPRPGGFAYLRSAGDALDLTLAVRPAVAGNGVGTALADAALADLPADGSTEGPGHRIVAWRHTTAAGADALAARSGFAAVRELLVMERPAAGLPDVAERSDVRVRSYAPDDAADLLRINAAAFAHHPEQGAMDERDLAERMAQDWFDPAGLLVAEDVATGAVLGFHWTKTSRRPGDSGPTGDGADGEVYVVGVAPEAQGRGLGKLLTLAGLHHLASWGVRRIELYVEGDNTTARAVYAGLGFEVVATHVQYARGGS